MLAASLGNSSRHTTTHWVPTAFLLNRYVPMKITANDAF
jgi:hypothetical protein